MYDLLSIDVCNYGTVLKVSHMRVPSRQDTNASRCLDDLCSRVVPEGTKSCESCCSPLGPKLNMPAEQSAVVRCSAAQEVILEYIAIY